MLLWQAWGEMRRGALLLPGCPRLLSLFCPLKAGAEGEGEAVFIAQRGGRTWLP